MISPLNNIGENMRKNIVLTLVLGVIFTVSICAKENPNIANDLKSRYKDSTKICSGDKPAYQCSGIIIRGINQANNLAHAWSLKPENKQKESFSFAFLRHDQPFSSFPRGYDSGFIMYPQLKTPVGKNTYKVYCAFPTDGGTDSRSGHGCGMYNNEAMSNHCDRVGITSYNAWVNNFNRIINSNNPNFVDRQCAFDMTIASRAKDFDIIRQANQYLQKNSSKYYMRNNELLVHAWNENNASPLPIEAFFYLIGSTNGLKHAQEFQRDYYNQANKEIVPIVGIKLPQTPNDELTVTYSKSEQVVGGGGAATNTKTYDIVYDRRGMKGLLAGFGAILPAGYSFTANKQYRMEINMPRGVSMQTCQFGSFYQGVCGAAQIKEYSYANGIFTPYKSGVLKGTLIGDKNFILPANTAGTFHIKITPL